MNGIDVREHLSPMAMQVLPCLWNRPGRHDDQGRSRWRRPIDPKRIRKGDLKSLLVFDRYDAAVTNREHDPYSPNFLQPVDYFITPTTGGAPFVVHHSRVLRFDGIDPLTTSRWTIYEQDWGVAFGGAP